MNRLSLGIIAGLVVTIGGCVAKEPAAPTLPHWSFSTDMIFPADGSLKRAEDGVALKDGQIAVADQFHGLRLISPDGSSRPFGKFAEAGYVHNPPEIVGGPNGVTLDPSGGRILVTDMFRGGIYEVDVASEETRLLHQHPYGVNVARRDRAGGIWFTQSTHNGPEHGEHELWQAVENQTADGKIFYMPPAEDGSLGAPEQRADGLVFANGIAIDEDRGYFYLSETMASRVLRYRLAAGTISDPEVVYSGSPSDNIDLDAEGRLWIALPLMGEIAVLEPGSDKAHTVIRVSNPGSDAIVAEIQSRLADKKPWLELLTPALWAPSPGPMTGTIITPNGGPIYVTGLGNALIKLER